MHDLIHDLDRHVASDAYLYVDNNNATSHDTTISVRHSSFVRGYYDSLKRLEAFGDMNNLRTFLTLPIGKSSHKSFLSPKVLLDLLLKLTRMRVLSLYGYRIKELPDLVGQLKHLRYLNMTDATIEKLPESVSSLFNLLTLILNGCRNLTELPLSIGNLVNLRYLDLDNTPKLLQMPSGVKSLTGLQKLPSHLPSIGKLQIINCQQLTTPLSTWNLASLTDLSFETCVIGQGSVLVHLSSLTKLCFANISDLCSLNVVNGLPCLHELKIARCPRLVSFGEISLPPTLKRLELAECEALETLPPMHAECFLEKLSIYGCNSLEYFPVGKEAKSSESVWWRVKSLLIRANMKLSLDIMVHNIETPRIENCPSLKCFPARGKKLPSSLKSLDIIRCRNLQMLTEGMLMQDNNMSLSLETICIGQCPSLTCFPIGGKLPTSLKKLSIGYCPELAAIPETLSRSSLEEIEIYHCPNLRKFPESLVQHNLKKVGVIGCEKLRSLPIQMNNLPSLVELSIVGCPSVRWSNIPRGRGLGLPLNLTSLSIGKTLNEKDMCRWGLDCLTTLSINIVEPYCLQTDSVMSE